MSRHTVPIKAGIDACEAFVGWDRPLQTYFVQVFRSSTEDDGEEEEILWEGADPGQLKTPDEALRLLAPWCDIPEGLSATLQIDRMKTLANRDGPAQAQAKAFLEQLKRRRSE
ncbi:hypothetical protein PK98_14415 [Croceibacterium mercuriale]|uniref:Uncharacterized protein n=1 Tax=Croceibacterium mercuriale TaxID=1572751 RepID=A0A0B2BRP7_9SPHN|nr:hypothetical protein [Croceibacterium mercuriale]KHL24193.1 hypothetical protein PK98_14415 [Croceibacterium mercuriale]